MKIDIRKLSWASKKYLNRLRPRVSQLSNCPRTQLAGAEELSRNPKRMPSLFISKPEVERSGSDGKTEE
jgi:hypothetical protein